MTRRGAPLLLAVVLGLASGGCTRSVCGFENGGLDPNVAPQWAPLRDAVPPTATICGHYNGSGRVDPSTLVIDFENDDNPIVTLIQHLESRGFQRVSQDLTGADSQNATLRRADTTLLVTTHREKGRVNAELSIP